MRHPSPRLHAVSLRSFPMAPEPPLTLMTPVGVMLIMFALVNRPIDPPPPPPPPPPLPAVPAPPDKSTAPEMVIFPTDEMVSGRMPIALTVTPWDRLNELKL